MSMEQKPPNASSNDAAEDRLSTLPDDVLVLILLRLDTEGAVRTSVLSGRWRHVWTLLPDLYFCDTQSHSVSSALSAGEVPLRHLLVMHRDPSPQSLAAWLPAAASRVTGGLMLLEEGKESEASERGTIELPCFEVATSISLHLGFRGLSMPPAGVFARLTDLHLVSVRFHGLADLGDAVSPPRFPCLQRLHVCNVRGLDSITVDSMSLQLLELDGVRGVRQVIVVAPALKDLWMMGGCFIPGQNQPVINISAPQLKSLVWMDAYDPSSVHLGSIEHLQKLVSSFCVYGPHGLANNHACLMLLARFEAIEYLVLTLNYPPGVHNYEYLMEGMTMIPDVTILQLNVMAKGHAFGACSFHVLRICSGIKRLVLDLGLSSESECSSNCNCDQPTSWKTEKLSMNHLQELEIEGYRASEHEVAFVKRLLNWVPVLRMMTVTCNYSITESKAKELFQMFLGFSRPGLCMKFYTNQNFTKVLYAPEG